MKVTSYEISKKLWKMDFSAQTYFVVYKDNLGFEHKWYYADLKGDGIGIDRFPAFHLETILDALPKQLKDNVYFTLNQNFVGYEKQVSYDDVPETDKNLSLSRKENESLADTAARLLLLLVEKGIVKFSKEEKTNE